MPEPTLDPGELWGIAAGGHDAPSESGGRSGEDVADFRLRLERLMQAVSGEADLNPLGRTMAHGQIVRAIRQRLALGRLWQRQPDVLATQLAAPIIIVGHMRSGTTRIHKLLASDPAHSHTRYCDAFHPVPARPDQRRAKAAAEIALLSWLNPWLQSIHPVAAAAVEEELGWLGAALGHSIYETQWRIPSYSAFSEAREAGPVYREFARLLRTDAWHRGNALKPRVLKVPVFCENLPELLSQFPEARLILAQRDPAEVLESSVSLAANQMAVQCDTCSIEDIRAFWRHKLALREERRSAALADWRGPLVEIDFAAMNEDWEREIARIYRELGLELSEPARAAMRAMMAASGSGAHRSHARQLQHFAAVQP
ncbi:MAG: sulfotransferase [Erythrobacter sp.]|nr:sulfotransferase [Erythrobacter sp.]